MSQKKRKKKKSKKKKSPNSFSQSKKSHPQNISIPQTIQLATQHHRTGNLSLAAQLYQQVLHADPDNADANHFLGIILMQQEGKIDLAVQLIRRAIQTNPTSAEAHNNLGNAFQKSGKLDEAIACYRKALAMKPEFAEIHNNLGNALKEAGKTAEAVASFRTALSIRPDFAEVYYRLGNVLHESGQIDEAVINYRKALAIKPGFADVHNNLGNIFQQAARLDEAITSFRRALAIKPDFVEALNNLGNALQESGMTDEAITSFRRALVIKPDFAEAHNNLGNALQESGMTDEAEASFKKALLIKPDFAEALYNLGNLLQQSGRLDEAVASFRKALLIRPYYGEAYRNLSVIEKHTEVDDTVQKMEDLYGQKDLAHEDRMHLGFALGKIFEEFKQYDKSFRFIAEANLLKRRSYEYSIQTDRDLFERIKKTFSPAFFSSQQGSGCLDETPIFIVGMPRSGTTLVEQILSSHPLVFGAGELMDLTNLTDSGCAGAATGQFPECVLHLDAAAFEKMGVAYIESLRRHSKKALYITDKMPHNFLRIGMIKAILPKARVIHCRREPMDTCLSIFKNYLGVKGSHKYAYDLIELGHYYRLYLDLMEHWERVLPGFIYDLRYEEMIIDQQKQTGRLLEFCGLAWNDACLAFHKTKRRVQTASCAQVRQPIYKDSIQLWKQYETQLEPLRTTLNR